jgi:hypothetical protein
VFKGLKGFKVFSPDVLHKGKRREGDKMSNSRWANFEDLKVYQKSRELVRSIYQVTRTSGFFGDRFLREQVHRSSISIVSNIAEGYERGTNAEFIRFCIFPKDLAVN